MVSYRLDKKRKLEKIALPNPNTPDYEISLLFVLLFFKLLTKKEVTD